WLFEAPCNPELVSATPTPVICSGNSVTLSIVPPDASTVNWYTSATSTSAVGSGSAFSTGPLLAPGTPTIFTFYVAATTCSAVPRSIVHVTVITLPQVSVTGVNAVCENAPVSFTATGANTYSWTGGATGSV